MHVTVLSLSDPARSDGGGRIRDHHLIEGALAELAPLDVYCFGDPTASRDGVTVASPAGPLGMVRALLSGRPVLGGRYDYSRFESVRSSIETAAVVYASMPYGLELALDHRTGPVVWDTHNIDSDVWEVRAATSRWPVSFAYRTQARAVTPLMRRGLDEADLVIACTPDDAEKLQAMDRSAHVAIVHNAVDFSAYEARDLGSEADTDDLAFFGSFDRPNPMHGLRWFATEVWPRIRQARPSARLRLIGRRPRNDVNRRFVESIPGAVVTFDVPSIADALSGARLLVLPERRGTGSKLKAVEALGTGLPLVSTTVGVMGLSPIPGHAMLADDPARFAADVVDALAAGVVVAEDELDTFRRANDHVAAQRLLRQELRAVGL